MVALDGLVLVFSSIARATSEMIAWVADRLLAPALVSVLFAGTTTLVIEWYRGRRDAVSRLTDTLRADLLATQELTLEYWSRRRAAGDAIVEAKIVAAQKEISFSLRLVHSVIDVVEIVDIDDYLGNLFDLLTGGDFQSSRRKPDPTRVLRISSELSKLRHDIVSARMKRIGPISLGRRRSRRSHSAREANGLG